MSRPKSLHFIRAAPRLNICYSLVNAGSWSMVSGFVELGLTWWQSILAVFTGAFILSIVVSLNGIIGARLHTPFAITSRASFGTNFYCFPVSHSDQLSHAAGLIECTQVISRMVIAWFWMAINSTSRPTSTSMTKSIVFQPSKEEQASPRCLSPSGRAIATCRTICQNRQVSHLKRCFPSSSFGSFSFRSA